MAISTSGDRRLARGLLVIACLSLPMCLACSSEDGSGNDDGTNTGFTWTSAAPCPVARFEATGVVVDDELWVMGGFTAATLAVTRRIDIYSLATDTWRLGPDLPGAETHMAAVSAGGDIIVAGGFSGSFEGGRPLPTEAVSRWNAETSEWSYEPSLPTRGAAFHWALLGNELHVAGGLAADGATDAAIHFVWDLDGEVEWTTAKPPPDAANHGGGAAIGGLFYAVAGRHGWNEGSGHVATVNAFDPVSGEWSARAPLPSPRSEIGAATVVLDDGRLLVVGGSLAGIVPSDEVLLYDPAGDTWSSLPPLPEARKGVVAALFGRSIVVTTGSPTSTDPSDTTFIGCCL